MCNPRIEDRNHKIFGIGKEFSSDITGDGPWKDRVSKWEKEWNGRNIVDNGKVTWSSGILVHRRLIFKAIKIAGRRRYRHTTHVKAYPIHNEAANIRHTTQGKLPARRHSVYKRRPTRGKGTLRTHIIFTILFICTIYTNPDIHIALKFRGKSRKNCDMGDGPTDILHGQWDGVDTGSMTNHIRIATLNINGNGQYRNKIKTLANQYVKAGLVDILVLTDTQIFHSEGVAITKVLAAGETPCVAYHATACAALEQTQARGGISFIMTQQMAQYVDDKTWVFDEIHGRYAALTLVSPTNAWDIMAIYGVPGIDSKEISNHERNITTKGSWIKQPRISKTKKAKEIVEFLRNRCSITETQHENLYQIWLGDFNAVPRYQDRMLLPSFQPTGNLYTYDTWEYSPWRAIPIQARDTAATELGAWTHHKIGSTTGARLDQIHVAGDLADCISTGTYPPSALREYTDHRMVSIAIPNSLLHAETIPPHPRKPAKIDLSPQDRQVKFKEQLNKAFDEDRIAIIEHAITNMEKSTPADIERRLGEAILTIQEGYQKAITQMENKRKGKNKPHSKTRTLILKNIQDRKCALSKAYMDESDPEDITAIANEIQTLERDLTKLDLSRIRHHQTRRHLHFTTGKVGTYLNSALATARGGKSKHSPTTIIPRLLAKLKDTEGSQVLELAVGTHGFEKLAHTWQKQDLGKQGPTPACLREVPQPNGCTLFEWNDDRDDTHDPFKECQDWLRNGRKATDQQKANLKDILSGLDAADLQASVDHLGLKTKSQAGPSHITYKMISITPQHILNLIFEVLLQTIRTEITPDALGAAIIKLIPKSAKVPKMRPIHLMNCFNKIIGNAFIQRYLNKTKTGSGYINQSDLHWAQHGFVPGRGCSEQLAFMEQLMAHARTNNKPQWWLYTDVSNCFPSVPLYGIQLAMQKAGFPPDAIRWLLHRLEHRPRKVIFPWAGSNGDTYRQERGFSQGSCLAPIGYCIFADMLLRWWETAPNPYIVEHGEESVSTFATCFADDTNGLSSARPGIENKLHKMEQFFGFFQMAFAPQKTMFTCINPKEPTSALQTMSGQDVRFISPAKPTKVLGCQISMSNKWDKALELTTHNVLNILTRLHYCKQTEAELRYIINAVIYPRVLYALQIANGTQLQKTCKRLDAAISKMIRLNISAPKDYIYLPAHLGGMGITPIYKKLLAKQTEQLLSNLNSTITPTRLIAANRLSTLSTGTGYKATTLHRKKEDSYTEQILRFAGKNQAHITAYTNKTEPNLPVTPNPRKYIWATDASTIPEITTHTASAAILLPEHYSNYTIQPRPRQIITECIGHQGTLVPSNNVGELYAILLALQATPVNAPCTIVTDSEVNINIIANIRTGMSIAHWLKLSNRPMLNRIRKILQLREDRKVKTKFTHVHSHNKITCWQEYWNDLADLQAKLAYKFQSWSATSIPMGVEDFYLCDEQGRYIDGSVSAYLANKYTQNTVKHLSTKLIKAHSHQRTKKIHHIWSELQIHDNGTAKTNIQAEITQHLLRTLPPKENLFYTKLRLCNITYPRQWEIYRLYKKGKTSYCSCGQAVKHLWQHCLTHCTHPDIQHLRQAIYNTGQTILESAHEPIFPTLTEQDCDNPSRTRQTFPPSLATKGIFLPRATREEIRQMIRDSNITKKQLIAVPARAWRETKRELKRYKYTNICHIPQDRFPKIIWDRKKFAHLPRNSHCYKNEITLAYLYQGPPPQIDIDAWRKRLHTTIRYGTIGLTILIRGKEIPIHNEDTYNGDLVIPTTGWYTSAHNKSHFNELRRVTHAGRKHIITYFMSSIVRAQYKLWIRYTQINPAPRSQTIKNSLAKYNRAQERCTGAICQERNVRGFARNLIEYPQTGNITVAARSRINRQLCIQCDNFHKNYRKTHTDTAYTYRAGLLAEGKKNIGRTDDLYLPCPGPTCEKRRSTIAKLDAELLALHQRTRQSTSTYKRLQRARWNACTLHPNRQSIGICRQCERALATSPEQIVQLPHQIVGDNPTPSLTTTSPRKDSTANLSYHYTRKRGRRSRVTPTTDTPRRTSPHRPATPTTPMPLTTHRDNDRHRQISQPSKASTTPPQVTEFTILPSPSTFALGHAIITSIGRTLRHYTPTTSTLSRYLPWAPTNTHEPNDSEAVMSREDQHITNRTSHRSGRHRSGRHAHDTGKMISTTHGESPGSPSPCSIETTVENNAVQNDGTSGYGHSSLLDATQTHTSKDEPAHRKRKKKRSRNL